MADIILPNIHKLWVRGVSMSIYSTNYDWDTGEKDFTTLGQYVYEYKYYRNLSSQRRDEIVGKCSVELSNFLKLSSDSPDLQFNSCIGVPPNREGHSSLPLEVAEKLSANFQWLRNDSRCVSKSRKLPIMKETAPKLRPEALRAGYDLDPNYDFKGIYGFLIVDDIYESGATLREICRTLKRAQPEIPRYVATFTHLSSVWSQHR